MKATYGGAKVLTAVEGIYKNGEVELLEWPEGLQEARVIVIFLPQTSAEAALGEARNRMLSRMRTGIHLGGPPYSVRKEVHAPAARLERLIDSDIFVYASDPADPVRKIWREVAWPMKEGWVGPP